MDPDMQPDTEESLDPNLQAKYEDLYAQMTLLLDDKETHAATVEMLTQAQQADMLAPQTAEMVVDVIARLEKDVGPIEEEIMMQLGEDLISDMEERYGVDLTDEQALQAASAAIALWMKRHPDRVEMGEQDAARVEQELQGMAPQQPAQQPGQQPAQGLIGGA